MTYFHPYIYCDLRSRWPVHQMSARMAGCALSGIQAVSTSRGLLGRYLRIDHRSLSCRAQNLSHVGKQHCPVPYSKDRVKYKRKLGIWYIRTDPGFMTFTTCVGLFFP